MLPTHRSPEKDQKQQSISKEDFSLVALWRRAFNNLEETFE